MTSKISVLTLSVLLVVNLSPTIARADVEPAELFCQIRDVGNSLNCTMLNKGERKTMSADDISAFIDQAFVASYITVKSRKGYERTFAIDSSAPQFRKVADLKKSASISEIAKAKNDLFSEIEKKSIRISDDLDSSALGAELIKFDPSIGFDKFRRESRNLQTELEGFKKNRDKVCTSTPAFEQMSKANAALQQSLSNILFAFQTPDSCMSDFKIFKDKDGSVDLRQLDRVSEQFKTNCKKK